MPPADLQGKLDQFVKAGPGGAVLVWVDHAGSTFFQAGSWSADDPQPVTPDTQFELGSLTKLFTALLLAESERQGRVQRLDSAAQYLLPADDPAQPSLRHLTLLALATHTSGLPRLPTNFGAAARSADPYARYDRAQLLAALRADGPGSAPDGGIVYSNFGAAVLGEALGAAWGSTYAEALAQQILGPLELTQTSVGLAGQPPPAGLAPAHNAGQRVPHWTALAFAPAGALRSSARDMAKFIAACLAPQTGPLGAAFAATFQPQFTSEESGGAAGLGWQLFGDPPGRMAWHNGATAGSHSFLALDRQAGHGLAILANFQQASEPLGFAILGVAPPQPKVPPVANGADYEGCYALHPAFVITIRAVQGGLRGQATGQPPFALRGVGADRFAVVGIKAELAFERDPAGTVAALVLHQHGRAQRGTRAPLPAAAAPSVVAPETLRQYAGTYPLAGAFVVTITETAGTLFAQASGQEKIPLIASAPDEFVSESPASRVRFQRDSNGRVEGLVLHLGGREWTAQRASA